MDIDPTRCLTCASRGPSTRGAALAGRRPLKLGVRPYGHNHRDLPLNTVALRVSGATSLSHTTLRCSLSLRRPFTLLRMFASVAAAISSRWLRFSGWRRRDFATPLPGAAARCHRLTGSSGPASYRGRRLALRCRATSLPRRHLSRAARANHTSFLRGSAVRPNRRFQGTADPRRFACGPAAPEASR